MQMFPFFVIVVANPFRGQKIYRKSTTIQESITREAVSNRNVFIVHGHDDALKNEVESFLKILKLKPIILHKEADLGKTIIEKVEHYLNVGFAVILLTKDDVGCSLGGTEIIPLKDNKRSISKRETVVLGRAIGKQMYRARQNVIFEFGFFIGVLGRHHVAALCRDGIERPSDIDGLLYTPLDQGGDWKKKLAKEIDASGIKIDEKFLT